MTATSLATAPSRSSGPRRWVANVHVTTTVGLATVIALWELIARTALDRKHLIAPPTGIVSAAVDNWNLYQRAVRYTLSEAAWGFLWGNVAAIALASLVAVLPVTERVTLRISLVVFCLPLVALGPTLRVIYGYGNGPQVTLSALGVFYTTLVPLLVGLRAVPVCGPISSPATAGAG